MTADSESSQVPPLLAPDEPAAFEVIEDERGSPFLITCDHAGKRLPRALGTLGLPESELIRHIAWDLGAAQVARALARELGAFAILQTYSRLAIDCNRQVDVPSSIPLISEQTVIRATTASPLSWPPSAHAPSFIPTTPASWPSSSGARAPGSRAC